MVPEKETDSDVEERLQSEGAEDTEPPVLEELIIDKVYAYLVERKRAGPLQIAKDLSLKVSVVMEALSVLNKRGKVKRVA